MIERIRSVVWFGIAMGGVLCGVAPGEEAVVEKVATTPAVTVRIDCGTQQPRDRTSSHGDWSTLGYCSGIGSNCA